MGHVELTLGIGIVFGLIGVAALLFGFELVPNEIAALGVLVLLVLLEPWMQMSVADALSGFASPVTITVLAIRRGDDVVRDAVETARLREGDSLRLQTTREQEEVLHTVRDLVVTRSTPAAHRPPGDEDGANRRNKMPVALGIVAAVIAVAAAGLAPIVITVLAGVVGMVVTGCVKTDEAYASVGWNVFFLMAGVIPLGLAMQKTGAATYLAGLVIGQAQFLPPLLILGLFYLLTALLANVIGNNASVIIMLPIAVDVALRVGAPPFSVVVAVTFAASTAFMTPVGYQTNLMVCTPGGYRFADFLRVGTPLQLLLAGVTTLGIALFWGV